MAILLGAILGAAMTYALPRVFEAAPPGIQPTAFISEVQLPITRHLMVDEDINVIKPIIPKLSEDFRRSLILLAEADKLVRLSIYELKIQNRTPRRSKAIDVHFSKAIFVALGDQQNKEDNKVLDATKLTTIRLNPLNPGGEALVTIVMPYEYTLYGASPIKVLHDDQLVELQPLRASPRFDIILWALAGDSFDRTMLLQLAVWGFFSLLGLILFAMVFTLLTRDSFSLMMKMYSKSDLDRTLRFADFIRSQRKQKDDSAPPSADN